MAAHIINMLTKSTLPPSLNVRDFRVGSWPIEDVCEALATMTARGLINGFDADQAYDDGEGKITLLAA